MVAPFFFAHHCKTLDNAARNCGMGHCVSRSMMSVFSLVVITLTVEPATG